MTIRTGSRIRLTKRALIMSGVEATYNTDPTLSLSTDAVLAMAPTYTLKPTVLSRNFVREDLSPLGTRIGRKIATLEFEVEVRGNGSASPGVVGNACIFGRLLRGCGYAQSAVTSTATIETPTNTSTNANNPTWAKSGASSLRNRQQYKITCVKAGASATAKLRVSQGFPCDPADASILQEGVTASVSGASATVTATVNTADPLAPTITIGGTFHAGDVITVVDIGVTFTLTVTSGMTDLSGIASALATLIDANALITATPSTTVVTIGYASYAAGSVVTSGTTGMVLGSSGCTVTPTFSGSLTLGDSWTVDTYPVGLRYDPRSDGFESMTHYGYFDGLKHVVTGSYGTFTITANAGEYATAKFTFTGQYHDPTDADVPDATYETSNPPVVQLAQLTLDDFRPVVNAFTFDQSNSIIERSDVSSPDGFNGVRITDRAPKGGIDPEATLGADYNFWTKFASSNYISFSMVIGSDVGNTILINAPQVQYTGMSYNDRSGLRTYDAGLSFNRLVANDEICFRTC